MVMLIFCANFLLSQVPKKMNYQAIIRNSSNTLLINTAMKTRISILLNNSNGTLVYSELHSPISNSNGLVTIEIGTGVPIVGSFSNINWGIGPLYLKTETDPSNGNNFTIVATSQLMSVPYALFADSARASIDLNNLSDFKRLKTFFYINKL